MCVSSWLPSTDEFPFHAPSKHYFQECFIHKRRFTVTGLFVAYTFLLSFFILVLCVGYQCWSKRFSCVMMADDEPHRHVHLLIRIMGTCFCCFGSHTTQQHLKNVGVYILCTSCVTWVCKQATRFHCVWLIFFSVPEPFKFSIVSVSFSAFSIFIIAFFSFSAAWC